MSRSTEDVLLVGSVRAAAGLAGAVVLVIFAFLVLESLPALRTVGPAQFFTDPDWYPAPRADAGTFGLTPMLAGTLLVTAGAVLLAVPLGVLSALFCHFHAPPSLAWAYRRLLELLAGIPSVVFGLWGLVVLVPLIARIQPPGQSLLAGILVLALMILPTVALLADAALAGVPAEELHGAAALGLSRWATLRGVVFPSAGAGLFTGVLLATGRALGETMAVLMVCGNIVQTPDSLFAPVRTLTANIALEMAYALDAHRSALFVSGLLLLVLVTTLVALAEWVGGGRDG